MSIFSNQDRRKFSHARNLAEVSTRPSLLVRMRSPADNESWEQFVDLYGPVVYRICRKKGLQSDDANEVVQDVLLDVLNNIGKFDYDPDRGRFRGWLATIVRTRLVRFWRKPSRGREANSCEELLSLQQSRVLLEDTFLEVLSQQAAERVKAKCDQDTWAAFDMAWSDKMSAQNIAQKMGRPVGWVYLAKSRVLQRLSDAFSELAMDCGWINSMCELNQAE